ncbi:MAG: hypothetical protein ABIF82_08775 [Planctomycetota bacterium]
MLSLLIATYRAALGSAATPSRRRWDSGHTAAALRETSSGDGEARTYHGGLGGTEKRRALDADYADVADGVRWEKGKKGENGEEEKRFDGINRIDGISVSISVHLFVIFVAGS